MVGVVLGCEDWRRWVVMVIVLSSLWSKFLVSFIYVFRKDVCGS